MTTFRVLCGSSHVAPDDPIVHPNMPGMSHLHQFFGNQTTNAASTAQSLANQATTCSAAADSSAYWVPMLFQNGVAVPAMSALIYYRGGSHRDPSQVQSFPAGLRMIAGDAAAAGPLPVDAVAWMCQGMSTLSTTPPDCGGGTLVLQLRFPDCWDGVNLDSADHKSHMAYTVSGFCPSNYPVPVPLLELNVRYQTNGNAGISLASGAPVHVPRRLLQRLEPGQPRRLHRLLPPRQQGVRHRQLSLRRHPPLRFGWLLLAALGNASGRAAVRRPSRTHRVRRRSWRRCG